MPVPSAFTTIGELCSAFPYPGRVSWLGLRETRRAPLTVVDSVMAVEGSGLEGDHYAGRHGAKRQVSLLQAEHLPVIASFVRTASIDPGWLRRNVVVEGINLLALKGKRFLIGDAILEWSGECHPCSRMEKALGSGGYNALRGHGGITARVVGSGLIRVGDRVQPL